MVKIVCIAALVGFIVSCKTAKNYVVSKESYEIINVLGKNLGKRAEDNLYYKTYAKEFLPIDNEYLDWSGYVNFDRFSQNMIPRKGDRKILDLRDYLTEEDLQHMREQITGQISVKWIKSRLASNIKLYKDIKKMSKAAQVLGVLNMYSEPVFSIDKKIALVYVITSGGSHIAVFMSKEKEWERLGNIRILMF